MTEFKQKLKKVCANPYTKWGLGYFVIMLCAVALIYYWRVAYEYSAMSAGTATMIVCGGFSILYFVMFAAANFIKQDFAKKAAILIFAAGLCFCFANPPLQAPDEAAHFIRAYAIASGNLDFNENEDYPTDVDILVDSFPGNYNFEMPLTDTSSIADAFDKYNEDVNSKDTKAPNATTMILQMAPYLAQSAGIAVGRLVGADALSCMYLGRIANLLFYSVMCFFALRVATKFKAVLVGVMLSPIALYMAASANSDGFLFGLMWLFIGICLSGTLTSRRCIAAAVAFGLLFAAKYNYLALLPLVLLIDTDKTNYLKNGKIKMPTKRVLMVTLFIIAGLIFMVLQNTHVSLFNNYTPQEYHNTAISPSKQMLFILSNPIRYIAVFIYSLYLNKGHLFAMGAFGWLDMVVPFVCYFAPLILCVASGLDSEDGAKIKTRGTIGVLLSALLMYGFTYTGMYLTSTPYTMPEIVGVQARYLLSAFLCCFVLLSVIIGKSLELQKMTRATPQKTNPSWRVLHVCFVFGIISAILIFQSYYIGA